MKLSQLFDVINGTSEVRSVKKNFTPGSTMVISTANTNNGLLGFYKVPTKFDPPIITVAKVGSVGSAFVQIDPCCPSKDCLILIPKNRMSLSKLIYVCIIIRSQRWRYCYGRKITIERIKNLEIDASFEIEIDEKKIKSEIESTINSVFDVPKD